MMIIFIIITPLCLESAVDPDPEDNRPKITIWDLEWSPDESKLAVVSQNHGVIVFETDTWAVVYENLSEDMNPETITWNSEGSILAVGGTSSGITLYDTIEWKEIQHIAENM